MLNMYIPRVSFPSHIMIRLLDHTTGLQEFPFHTCHSIIPIQKGNESHSQPIPDLSLWHTGHSLIVALHVQVRSLSPVTQHCACMLPWHQALSPCANNRQPATVHGIAMQSITFTLPGCLPTLKIADNWAFRILMLQGMWLLNQAGLIARGHAEEALEGSIWGTSVTSSGVVQFSRSN